QLQATPGRKFRFREFCGHFSESCGVPGDSIDVIGLSRNPAGLYALSARMSHRGDSCEILPSSRKVALTEFSTAAIYPALFDCFPKTLIRIFQQPGRS